MANHNVEEVPLNDTPHVSCTPPVNPNDQVKLTHYLGFSMSLKLKLKRGSTGQRHGQQKARNPISVSGKIQGLWGHCN